MSDYPDIQQFRIWSPDEGKFYFSGGTPSMLSSFFSQTATLHTVHKMPYQRDTFLHDKNEKNVCEGDIVRGGIGNLVKIGSIRYEEGAFWVYVNGWDKSAGGLLCHFPCEIIGDIYSNPDLLK